MDADFPGEGRSEEGTLLPNRRGIMFSAIEVVANPIGLKHVRLITINRPDKLNSLDGNAALLLCNEIIKADKDLSVRALVITGCGEKAFCAGADLGGIFEDESVNSEGGASSFGKLFTAMRNSGVPIIAAVNGLAVGGGLGIVLASDLVVMSSETYVGTPEIRRGLFALYISRFLYEVLPEKVANEILYLGKTLTAVEAKSYNLVNRVVEQNKVLSEALNLAEQISQFSGSVLRLGKRSLNGQKNLRFDEAICFLGQKLDENLSLVDAKEGIKAFLAKCKPVWKDG